jgi:hypothetical protein
MTQPETQFKMRVQARLKEIPNAFFYKVQQVALRGIPDIVGCVKGHFVALELKVGKNRADKLQKWTMNEIKEAGGYAFEVTPDNFNDIFNILWGLGNGFK